MKKFTKFSFIVGLVILGSSIMGFSQNRPFNSHANRHSKLIQVSAPSKVDDGIGAKPANVYVSNRSVLDDPITMMTKYDLQSNKSSQNRLYLFPDGTMGSTATMSHLDGGSWADRGTGINMFDGTNWGALPATRIENEKCGWPSYAPYGPNGEIVVTHTNASGLNVAWRATKGSGAWTQSILAGPAGVEDLSWPRMVTNGPDHTYIHIICMTYSAYQGLDLALLYYRSLDGGQTWETEHRILEGMTSADYFGFSADTYAWAEPHGDTLAFTNGYSWYDQILMKSTDNGNTWTKTVIYSSPYNMEGLNGSSPGFFYCPDGTGAVVLDKNGMAHVTFGLVCDSIFGNGTNYYSLTWQDGIVYWNESMPTLRPDLDPDSLYANHQLIGWVKDTMVFYQDPLTIADYFCSLTCNPSMAIDDNDNLFVVWAGLTTLVDPDGFMLRHIFERTAALYPGNGVIWNDSINDLTSDFLYTNTECFYPDISPNTTADNFYVSFQADDYAGGYVKGLNVTGYAGQTSITENNIIILSPLKSDVGVGVNTKKKTNTAFTVSNNYPNPCNGTTTITANLQRSGNISLELTNITGQKIYSVEKGWISAGTYQFRVDASQFSPGIYFYTVRLDNESITKKMVVE
jgi:hypothetical protein